jgi:hypothetical protein
MIARPLNRFKPIPFSNPMPHTAGAWSNVPAAPGRAPVQWQPLAAQASRLQAAEPSRTPPGNPWGAATLAQLTGNQGHSSSNDANAAPSAQQQSLADRRAAAQTGPSPKAPQKRSAMARYDGPHSLSIRSATSGRHYRFEHSGATQAIDAIDIALMRRIEDITLL